MSLKLTKLMKRVYKQSGAIHARFHGSSGAKKTENVLSSINKTGERFRSRIAKLSVGHTWSLIRKEWIIIKQVEMSERREKCLCGRSNLKLVTYLKNKENNNQIAAGNCFVLTLK